MSNPGSNSNQSVSWVVGLVDGKVTGAVATPSDYGPLKMWRRIDSKRINPDKSEDSLVPKEKLQKPFMEKPVPVVSRATN